MSEQKFDEGANAHMFHPNGGLSDEQKAKYDQANEAFVKAAGGPPRDEIFKFFKYDHLPAHLQEASKVFADVADWVEKSVPRSAERTAGLRKLLEAKDCVVRAKLP